VQVAGSDAHTLRRVGAAWTEASGATAAEFLDEIRAGRCRVGGTAASLWGLIGDVHAVIGEYYLRLYTGRGEAAGAAAYTKDLLVATACLPAAFGPFPSAVTALHQARQKLVSRHVLARLSSFDWPRFLAAEPAAAQGGGAP